MTTLEKNIESAFVKYARKRGCEAIKFTDPARNGAPDRIVLCPRGKLFFAEFKAPGKKPRPGQLNYHRILNRLNYQVFTLDDLSEAKRILDDFLSTFVST